jgi:glyoxylase I family protein
MIKGIEHTAIASPNPPALADWYVETLGFVINYRGSTAVFVKAPDGTMIEIIAAEGDRAAQTLKTPGLRHVALTVTDFDVVYASLKAKGVQFLSDPMDNKGNKLVFFTDPEGNYLHLLQRATPLA